MNTLVTPMSSALSHSTLTLHHAIGGERFKEERPTVVVLLMYGRELLLVQPSKDEYRDLWMPPQGGIEYADRTLVRGALRELNEELGIRDTDLEPFRMVPLGEYRSTLSLVDTPPKRYYYVGAILRHAVDIKLNWENSEFRWVRSLDEVMSAMRVVAKRHAGKFEATIAAVRAAGKHRLIPWAA